MRFLPLLLFVLNALSSAAQVSQTRQFFNGHISGDITGSLSVNFYQSGQMNKYDMRYLKLDITVQPPTSFISGTCMYKAMTTQLLDTFSIEFKDNMVLDSAFINNTKRTFTRGADHVNIALNPTIAAGTLMDIVFYYHGTPGSGIYIGSDAATGLVYTANVSESYQAREWFPAKQILADKIDSSDVWITTAASNLAGSNGLLKRVLDLPGSRKQYQWASRYPIAYYLVSFAVANYMEYRNYAKPASIAPDSIPVLHYLVNNPAFFNAEKARLDKTPAFIEKMSELFGTYPFAKEKYGHAQANIGGGMEHQTMTTLQNFDEQLVAHELGHQWFGDNVTCATWNDIWLNESFAGYCQILMLEKLPALFPTTAAMQMGYVHANVMSKPGGSVYVPMQEAYNEGRIFDGRLSYDKGTAVLQTLRFEMQSDTLFFNTLKTYQQKFKASVANTNDFKLVAEQVSGRSFSDFFNQWIFGEGYPTYNITYNKQGSDTLLITIVQTTSMSLVTPLFKGLIALRIKSLQGDTIVICNQLLNTQTFKFKYTKTPSGIDVDPDNQVLNGAGSVIEGAPLLNPGLGEVQIFPNPARDVINIRMSANSFTQLGLFDVQGRILYRTNISPLQSLFILHYPLPAGYYFIHLYGREKSVTRKILISR